MHPSTIFIPLLLGLAAAQAPAATLVATQSPTVTEVTSLQTAAGGSVVGVPVVFTQTFAATALGSWPLGTAVQKGTVGLGDIAGSVGGVKTA